MRASDGLISGLVFLWLVGLAVIVGPELPDSMTGSNAAAWVQGIGSILAIVFAACLPTIQRRHDVRNHRSACVHYLIATADNLIAIADLLSACKDAKTALATLAAGQESLRLIEQAGAKYDISRLPGQTAVGQFMMGLFVISHACASVAAPAADGSPLTAARTVSAALRKDAAALRECAYALDRSHA